MQVTDRYGEPLPPFGAWLLMQRDRGDEVDGVAETARADRAFPRNGDVDAVAERLAAIGASQSALAVLAHAELDWLTY